MTAILPESSSGPETPPTVPFARPIAHEFVTAPALVAPEFLLLSESPRSAWADLGWLALLLLVLEFAASGLIHLAAEFMLGASLSPSEPEAAPLRQAMLLPAISLRALGAIVIISVLARRRRLTARSVGLSWSRLPLNIAIGLAALLFVYALIAMVTPLVWLWPGLVKEMEENARRIMELVPNLRPVEYVPLTIIIGVYEELVFRGFLMTRLRRATGRWTPALILSTAVFTALHAFDQTGSALIMVALLSVVFSLVTIWRRSIVPAIVAHALFDLSQLLLLQLQMGDAWT